LLGLIPFFPGASNVTGNISVTLVLALFTYIVTTVNGNKGYWMHMIWMPGVPVAIRPILAVIELIGTLTKPFALMMRLFANIAAGHILILALISLIFIMKTAWMSLASVPFVVFMSVLELLVAALQAFIFTLLSALFIGMAVAEHDHDHAHEGHH
jgi:F-type H+-transporting ATPase subunit a